jgi:hypothetical protein
MNQAVIDEHNKKILATLLAIQKDVAEIKRKLANGAPAGRGDAGPQDGAVASDRDLDGERGDPTIRFDPSVKYWNGESFAGYHYSETTPDYLDALAKYLDASAYMAAKDEDEKKRNSAKWKRLDASRARGWSQRLRNGWTPPAPAPQQSNGAPSGGADDYSSGSFSNDDEIPF